MTEETEETEKKTITVEHSVKMLFDAVNKLESTVVGVDEDGNEYTVVIRRVEQ